MSRMFAEDESSILSTSNGRPGKTPAFFIERSPKPQSHPFRGGLGGHELVNSLNPRRIFLLQQGVLQIAAISKWESLKSQNRALSIHGFANNHALAAHCIHKSLFSKTLQPYRDRYICFVQAPILVQQFLSSEF